MRRIKCTKEQPSFPAGAMRFFLPAGSRLAGAFRGVADLRTEF